MSQKIVIPKGTIDSAHTTIIEIPNYLHETSTVVVTTPKTADSSTEQRWEAKPYVESVEQNEDDWGQGYDDVQEANEDAEYPSDQQDQYVAQQYDSAGEVVVSGNEEQQLAADQGGPYVGYVEELPAQPVRRPKFDPFSEQIRRQVMDKKRELMEMRAERQRVLEGESGTYEAVPDYNENVEEYPMHLSEVPEGMRGRSQTREQNFEKEKKRRQHEFERYQPYPPQIHPSHQSRYSQREQGTSKYPPALKNQQYVAAPQPVNQQWNPNTQKYPEVQYVRQGQPRVQTAVPRRQLPGQVDFVREEARQNQKLRRKPMFNIPRN